MIREMYDSEARAMSREDGSRKAKEAPESEEKKRRLEQPQAAGEAQADEAAAAGDAAERARGATAETAAAVGEARAADEPAPPREPLHAEGGGCALLEEMAISDSDFEKKVAPPHCRAAPPQGGVGP